MPLGGANYRSRGAHRLAPAKPGFVDRLVHHAYAEDGGRMATFESASARLDAVAVLGR